MDNMTYSRPRLWLWWLGVLLLVGSVGGAAWLVNPLLLSGVLAQPPKGQKAGAGTVASGPVVCHGYVDVKDGIANLYPLQPGRVKMVASEGPEELKEGTVLLEIDDSEAKLRRDAAQVEKELAEQKLKEAERLPEIHSKRVEQMEKAVKAAKYQLEEAKKEVDFLKGVGGNVNKIAAAQEAVKKVEVLVKLQEAKLEELKLENPQDAIRQAKLNLQAKKVQLDLAQLAVDECRVKAPTKGMVLRAFVHVGEVLTTNRERPALQFCPVGARIIRAEVQQEWASRVKVGQKVIIEDDTTSAWRWTGTVRNVSDWFTQRRSVVLEPFQYNDVRTLECVIENIVPQVGDNEASRPPLRIGQRVRVKI